MSEINIADELKEAAELKGINPYHAELMLNAAGLIGSMGKKITYFEGVKIEELSQDCKRLDWLADTDHDLGQVSLPSECVLNNAHSMRAAIAAMALDFNLRYLENIGEG